VTGRLNVLWSSCVMRSVNSWLTCNDARNIDLHNSSRYGSIRYTQYRFRYDTDPIIVCSLMNSRLTLTLLTSGGCRKFEGEGAEGNVSSPSYFIANVQLLMMFYSLKGNLLKQILRPVGVGQPPPPHLWICHYADKFSLIIIIIVCHGWNDVCCCVCIRWPLYQPDTHLCLCTHGSLSALWHRQGSCSLL